MDDQKFMNAYVDTAVGTIHEYINIILQLKSKLKVASDMVVEKEEIIGQLRSDLEGSRKSGEEISEANQKARSWEEQFNAMKNKLSHMETLSNQYTELKRLYIEKEQEIERIKEQKDKEIQSLEDQITKSNNKVKLPPKKVINTKNIVKEVAAKSEEKIDDF